ncbi:tyrosine-type recombinase/integrase [Azospirillum thiophilum]|uniref:tyrosine-type recombinase/integrase n=1 Tax=Azospirillum thiophilum TaxID=528244 RepID=UPI000AF726A8|nr:tyrosine-type recombinase/integrase [Azospirillum thiophilum]
MDDAIEIEPVGFANEVERVLLDDTLLRTPADRDNETETIDADFEEIAGGNGSRALVVTEPTVALPAIPVPVVRTDADVIEGWLKTRRSARTRRAYRDDIRVFLRAVGWKPLATITDIDIQDHIDTAMATDGRPLAPRSCRRRLSAIRSLFHYACTKKHLAVNEAISVTLEKSEDDLAQRVLSNRAVRAMIAAAKPPRDRAIVTLLYVAGLRISEVAHLRWKHLRQAEDGDRTERHAATLTVFGKGAKTRHVLLPEIVVDHLDAVHKVQGPLAIDEAPIFRSRKRSNGGHLDASAVHRIVKGVVADARRSAEAAGDHRLLADLKEAASAHWLRHSHATHALKNGAPIHVVRDTLGHANVSTTNRYLAIDPDESSTAFVTI